MIHDWIKKRNFLSVLLIVIDVCLASIGYIMRVAANAKIKDKNILQLAVLSRIKIFVRPQGLVFRTEDVPNSIEFISSEKQKRKNKII